MKSEVSSDRTHADQDESVKEQAVGQPNASLTQPSVSHTEFTYLLNENDHKLQLYLQSLTHDWQVTADLLQETYLVMWREYSTFLAGTSFSAWSRRIAFNRLLAWRAKQRRSRVQFSDEFIHMIADEWDRADEHLEHRLDALKQCLDQLPSHHSELVSLRYSNSNSIEDICERLRKTPDSIYRQLSRIRRILHECITNRLAQERRA